MKDIIVVQSASVIPAHFLCTNKGLNLKVRESFSFVSRHIYSDCLINLTCKAL